MKFSADIVGHDVCSDLLYHRDDAMWRALFARRVVARRPGRLHQQRGQTRYGVGRRGAGGGAASEAPEEAAGTEAAAEEKDCKRAPIVPANATDARFALRKLCFVSSR